MDLAADFAVPLPMLVIAEMLGIPAAERDPLKRWSDAILDLSDAVAGGETAARAVAAFRDAKTEMAPHVARWLDERRAAPRDDLLTRLVEAEVDGERLADEEILGFFQLLLLAGSETTTNLIGNAVLCFAENPEQLARLRADPACCRRRSRRSCATARRCSGLPPDAARRGGARQDDPRRQARAGDDRLREPRSRGSSAIPAGSTSPAIRTRTSRSGTASTSASARRWPAWRPGSRWRISSRGSRVSGSPGAGSRARGSTSTARPACPSALLDALVQIQLDWKT